MALPQQRHDRIEDFAEGAVRTTPPVIAPGHTFQSVTDRISSIILTKRTPIGWFLGFGIAFLFLLLLTSRWGICC